MHTRPSSVRPRAATRCRLSSYTPGRVARRTPTSNRSSLRSTSGCRLGQRAPAGPRRRRKLDATAYAQVARLAERLTAGESNGYDAAVAINDHLRTTYAYDEKPPEQPAAAAILPVPGQARLLPAVLRRDGADAADGRNPRPGRNRVRTRHPARERPRLRGDRPRGPLLGRGLLSTASAGFRSIRRRRRRRPRSRSAGPPPSGSGRASSGAETAGGEPNAPARGRPAARRPPPRVGEGARPSRRSGSSPRSRRRSSSSRRSAPSATAVCRPPRRPTARSPSCGASSAGPAGRGARRRCSSSRVASAALATGPPPATSAASATASTGPASGPHPRSATAVACAGTSPRAAAS